MGPKTIPPEQLQRWRRRLMEKSGTFVAILVFNLAILLLLGGRVIYQFVVQENSEPVATFKIKPIPPPPKPPAHGGEASKSLADPSVVVVPPTVSMPSIVTSTAPAVFNIKTADVPVLTTAMPSFADPTGRGQGQGTSGGGAPQSNPFGGALDAGTPPALVGYFYDLKQTNQDPPTPTNITRQGWRQQMDKLVGDNLNENDLSHFLKSADPRSTSGFEIPEQASTNAPAAFGLAGKVAPNLWAIVYHGKAAAPESGRFRFVGFGDDVLYIKMNHKLVFDGGWQSLSKDASLHDTYPFMWSSVGKASALKKGSWFEVSQGDVMSFDILIGDWGGKCGYFLMIEKDGATYDKASDSVTPKLPLFQVGSKLPISHGGETPPLTDSDSVWTPVNDQL